MYDTEKSTYNYIKVDKSCQMKYMKMHQNIRSECYWRICTMPSEHEFVRLRLAAVERQLQHGPSAMVFESAGRGRRRPASDSGTREESSYKREIRLLHHILAVTRDGQVMPALTTWRARFGRILSEHRQQYRTVQEQYDVWWALPPYQRERRPQPPRPPLAHHRDQTGQDWIIDDRFLHLLDDLHERLTKWMSEP